MTRSELESLVSEIAACKRVDPLAPVTILVPSNVAARTVGWRLAEGLGNGLRGVAGIRITRPAQLADDIAARHLFPRRPLVPAVLSAAIRGELMKRANDGGADKGSFGDVAGHPATVAALVSAYRDLRETELDEIDLDSQSAVTRETIDIVRAVRASLTSEWFDERDLLDRARELVDGDPTFGAVEYGTFVHYLPGEETPSERRFLDVLPGLLKIETGHVMSTATSVMHSSDSDDEIRAVVREVVAALETSAARRLAVVYPSPAPYAALLHDQLRGAGIEFNGRGGTPIADVPPSRTFLSILGLAGSRYSRRAVFEAFTEWPCRQWDGASIPSVRWERISREAHIAGGLDFDSDWAGRLDRQAEGYDAQAAQQTQPDRVAILERNAADTRALRTFMIGLRDRLEELHRAATWRDVGELAAAFMASVLGSPADARQWHEEAARSYTTLLTCVRALSTLDQYGAPAGLQSIIDALSGQLERVVPQVGKFGHGIFVGAIEQARGMDLDHIWVVGLSEDAMPGRRREDALLPDALRAKTDGLWTLTDKVERAERDCVAAFQAAPIVTATFPRGDLRRSTERLPSRFLLPTLRALSGVDNLQATQWSAVPAETIRDCASFASGLLDQTAPATVQEWQTREVAALRSIDRSEFDLAAQLLTHRRSAAFTRFDGNLAGAAGLPDYADGSTEVSASRLENYGSCPFAFFVERLLQVRPVEEPKATATISPMDLGNVIHNTWDRFFRAEQAAGTLPQSGEAWGADHAARLHQSGETVMAKFAEQGLTGHPTMWMLERPKIHRSLASMLIVDSEWRRSVNAAPAASEFAFGAGFDQPSAEFELTSGVVRFAGYADKVDLADDAVFVTDIKSGGASSFRGIAADEVQFEGTPHEVVRRKVTAGGTKLQLPIYGRAAQRAFGGTAHARYWFVHKAPQQHPIELELSDETVASFTRDVGVLVESIKSGLFPKKPEEAPDYLWVRCHSCTPGGFGHEQSRAGYEALRGDPALQALIELIDYPYIEGQRAALIKLSEAEG